MSAINKDLNEAINNLDALDTYLCLAAKKAEVPFIKEIDELVEMMKVNMRNIRDNYSLVKKEAE